MRVVVDTNILVGACLGKGAANDVIAACLRGKCQPLMGAALLVEYEAMLSRHDLFTGSRLSAAERFELLDIFLSACIWTRIYYLWRPNLRDGDDNHLIELAVAGNACFVVTRNLKDFRNAEWVFPHIRPGLPEDFLLELA